MNQRKLAEKELENNGYHLKRNGARHDIYFNPDLKAIIPLKRHDFDEDDLRYIKKEIRHNQKGRD